MSRPQKFPEVFRKVAPEGEQETFSITMPAVTVRVESTGDRIAAAFMFQGLPVETEWVIGKHILENFQQLR